jgi:pimeloyl-ACP methyl ester carboxylesterase
MGLGYKKTAAGSFVMWESRTSWSSPRCGLCNVDLALGHALSRLEPLTTTDELHLSRVSVLGWAAGVPYALAAAARAPDRVSSISLVGPWFEGEARDVDPSSPTAVSACRDELGRTFAPLFELLDRGPTALLEAVLAGMPEPDRRIAPATRAMLASSYAEGMRQGVEPAIDEGLVIRTRWPFALEDIECNVEVWSGDADTRAAPSLRLLSERLPRARQVALAAGGHYLVFTHGKAILSSLTSGRS